MLGVIAAVLALQQVPARPALARAESLLAVGRLAPAREVAESLEREHPDDPAVLTVLGRIWTEWPVFGRYKAESLLTRAGELDPTNPAPFLALLKAGLRLGQNDGEGMERRALVHLLWIDPAYPDAWTLWHGMYRNDGDRKEAVRALAHHGGQPAADQWRAGLLIELRRYRDAEAVLRDLVHAHPDDPAPRAVLAQALYEQGRDAKAAPIYRAALDRAAHDTGGVLWAQVRSLASPDEARAYPRLVPEQRAAFLRLLWARRNPNLSDSLNAYIGEHFRRLAVARRGYQLKFPWARWYRSATWRLVAGDEGNFRELPGPGTADAGCPQGRGAGTGRCYESDGAMSSDFGPGSDPGLGPGFGRPADPAQIAGAIDEHLEDRGLVFVRYGKPKRVVAVWGKVGATRRVLATRWIYDGPGRQLTITFKDLPGASGVAEPSWDEHLVMTTDRAAAPSTLKFTVWMASFRRGRGDRTEMVLFPDSVAAVAELFDNAGEVAGHDSATDGPLHLIVAPGGGQYLLALDGSRDGLRNGYRDTVTVPFFPPDSLGVSSLLVASGDVAPRRDSLEAAAPPGLRLPAGRPWRVYAEVYGLQAVEGAERYSATYQIERLAHATGDEVAPHGVTTLSFVRMIRAADPAIESLVIDPGRLPPGRYRLRIFIRDAVSGAVVASPRRVFELR